MRGDHLHDFHAVRQAREGAAGTDDIFYLGKVLAFGLRAAAARSVDIAQPARVTLGRLQYGFLCQPILVTLTA